MLLDKDPVNVVLDIPFLESVLIVDGIWELLEQLETSCFPILQLDIFLKSSFNFQQILTKDPLFAYNL